MRTTSLYKRIALITLTLITGCLMVRAYDFESSGIYYNVDGDHAIVTNNGQTKCYGGNVNIPESVTLDGIANSVMPHSANAYSPILVTVEGMATLLSPVEPLKALSPMAVTV